MNRPQSFSDIKNPWVRRPALTFTAMFIFPLLLLIIGIGILAVNGRFMWEVVKDAWADFASLIKDFSAAIAEAW